MPDTKSGQKQPTKKATKLPLLPAVEQTFVVWLLAIVL
jgi:hypothetical protein